MRQSKLTTRGAALAAALALAAAGCGDDDGGGSPPTPPEPATIPAMVGEKLAKKSDEVAAKLNEGDLCEAARKADELAREVDKAADRIPPELLSELRAGTEQLVNTANCPPPPEPEKGKGKDKDEEEGDGEGDYGEEEIFGEGDGDSAPGNSGNAPGHNKGGGD